MLITGRFTILASCRGDGEAEGEGVGGKRGGMSSKNSLKEGLCWAEVGGGQPGGAINCLQMNQRCHKQPTIMQVHPWQVHVLLAQHKTCAVRAHSSGCLCVPVFLCFYKLAAVAGATTGVTHPLRIQLARGQGDHAAGAGVLEQRQGVGRLELHHNVAPCAAGALRTQPLLPIQLVQQDGRPGVAGGGGAEVGAYALSAQQHGSKANGNWPGHMTCASHGVWRLENTAAVSRMAVVAIVVSCL